MEWQAGSLPYEGPTAAMLLKKQLREYDETVRLKVWRPSVRTVRWIDAVADFVSKASMPISTSCEKCDRPLRAKSSLAGKVVRCPQCGGEIRIPTESADSSESEPLRPRVRGRDEPVDMPALQRQKYRPKRENWFVAFRKQRFLNIRLTSWATVLVLVLVIGLAFDRVRSGPPNRQAGPQAVVGQDTAEQGVAHPLPTQKHRPDPVATGPEEADRPAPAESKTAQPALSTPPTMQAPEVATASVDEHAATTPAMGAKPAIPVDRKNNNPADSTRFSAVPNTNPENARKQVEASSQVGEPPNAPRGDAWGRHVGAYSKQDPPEVDDIVTVLVGGPPLVGKVTKVDTKANKCKLKIIDAREFELSGTVHETSRTRTVRIEQLKPHPRMKSEKQPTESKSPPTPKPTSSGL
jgi:hypothetical protein